MQKSKPNNKLNSKVSLKVKPKINPKVKSKEGLKSNLRSKLQAPHSTQPQPRNAPSVSSQASLLPKDDLKYLKSRTHGGTKSGRKVKRPLIPGAITHVVLKSSQAKGNRSFYKNKVLIHSLLKSIAKKYFVEIKAYVNMGNHLHIKARFKDIKSFQNFLRVFTGVLARKLTKANRGSVFGKFWDGLTYTRVLLSKFEELGLKGYFEANHRQRELGYDERERYLKAWNQFLCRLKKPPKGRRCFSVEV